MGIKEIMEVYGYNIKGISDRFQIPYRTVQNWAGGQRECPQYILKMMNEILSNSKEEKEMTREMEIEILMKDRCTKKEAEKHLKNGTLVIEDFEEHFDGYMEEWDCDEEEIEKMKKMVETKDPAVDWGVVCFENKYYYIMYCL